MRKIIYLINPISGTSSKLSLLDIIKRENHKRGINFEIVETNPAGNYHFLIGKIKAEKITDVVICGGDGTINAVTASLIGTPVNIGIIPRGSGNGLAFSAGIPKQTGKALAIIFAGTSSPIDGFYINEHFSCMLCGIGFDAQVALDFSKEKRRGLQTYIKVAAINYFSAKAYKFDIEAQDNAFTTEAFFISIANSNQFGNNVTIAPKASLSDGLLDIVIVNKMNKLVLPFSLLSQVTGINARQDLSLDLQRKNVIYFQAPAVTIINKEDAPLHIDGDPKPTARKFEIKIIHNAFRLLQPMGA